MQQRLSLKKFKKSSAELEANGFAKIDAKSQTDFFKSEEISLKSQNNSTVNPPRQKIELAIIDEYGYYSPK